MKSSGATDLNLTLVRRLRDDDDEGEQFKPLEWGLIRRLFGYTQPVKRKVRLLIALTIIRSAQLPGLVWIVSLVIAGPITRGDVAMIAFGTACYAALAVLTDGLFHFRQRFALEIGETVVNAIRAEIFAKVQRQPMSFFHRMKLGRIISRVTSDVEALRVGIQDVAFVSTIQLGQMVFSAAVMAWWDWKLFLVVAAMAPVLWMVNNHFRMKFSRLTRASQDSFSRVTATLAESVGGIRVTQGFVRQETNAGLFDSFAIAGAEQPVLCRNPASPGRVARLPRQHGNRRPDQVLPDGEPVLLADHDDWESVQPGVDSDGGSREGFPADRHGAGLGG
jgi:ATP-binding cassette subfamily B protein